MNISAIIFGAAAMAISTAALAQVSFPLPLSPLEGPAAFGDWHGDAPGVARQFSPADLPEPIRRDAAETVNIPKIVPRPADNAPQVPSGFRAQLFGSGLQNPRNIRVAPDGDLFVAESKPGRIRVFRANSDEEVTSGGEIFASGLNMPFGIAFYPPGPEPEYVYIGDTDAILRFPYRNGDTKARGAPERILHQIPVDGHWTRDIVFSPDGQRMFISVGSLSNDAEAMLPRPIEDAQGFEHAGHAIGGSWGVEQFRADVLIADPDGSNLRVYATGLRNCVGMAIHPGTGDLWCSNNERDRRGDNLVPDFITRVHERDFFGWPWFYIGAHEDPFHQGERPDLAEVVSLPDVLIQAHSAPLAMAFYDSELFPPDYRGDLFVALHGSYNHTQRTGYKVIRVRMQDGRPTGAYEDFMTGFIVSDVAVWGRPVGIAVAKDGALLVSEDGNGTIWRVTH